MADQKISEFDPILSSELEPDSDFLPIVDNSLSVNKRILVSELFKSPEDVVVSSSTAGTVALKALRPNNIASGNPVVIVAGDGDSGDVLLELRGNADGTAVDTADAKESADAKFIFYGNGASTFEGPMTLNGNLDIDGRQKITGIGANLLTLNRDTTSDFLGITWSDPSDITRWLTFIPNNVDADFTFQARDATGTIVGSAMRLDNSDLTVQIYQDAWVGGDLGVGTINPSAKLDVVGNAEINGNLTVSGTITGSLSYTNLTITSNLDVGGDISSRSNTADLKIFGGTVGDGANIELYGSTSSNPNLAVIDAGEIRMRGQAGSPAFLILDSSIANFSVPVQSSGSFQHDSPDNADQDILKAKTLAGDDFFKIRAENINDTNDRADIRFQGGINSVVWDLDNGLAGFFEAPSFRVNGQIVAENAVRSGVGTGGVALTANDGGGESNVTFNHTSQEPDVSGNSARIKFNSDTVGGAQMEIRMKSSVTAGVTASLDPAAIFREDYQRFFVNSGSEMMRLNSTGAGIGINSPAARLHVSSGSTDLVGLFQSTDTNAIVGLKDNTTSSNTSVGIEAVGDTLHLRSNDTRRVVVTDTGDVGIDTATPGARLHVTASGVADLSAIFESTDAGSVIGLKDNTTTADTSVGIRALGDDLFLRSGNANNVTVTSGGNVGVGTSSPTVKMHVSGSGRFDGDLNVDSGVLFVGSTANRVGINKLLPTEALDVVGNVTISGSLAKGSGSFKIDHPLKPDTHYLVHSFVEAPQADNIYRGRVDLVNGVATINLDEAARMTEGTFVKLNGNVQCFTSNETDWCPVRGSVNGNILTIEAQDNTCTDSISWMVIGERIDQHMIDIDWTDAEGRIIVEPEKESPVEEAPVEEAPVEEAP